MPFGYVIDIDSLVAPISDDMPQGSDVRADRSPTSDYYVIKDARNNARAAERSAMFGDVEVTDFDGTVLPEKDMVRRWGALFTPSILFFPEEVAGDVSASQAAVATMPGAFEKHTTFNMLSWVVDHGYEGEESFQKYHARKFAEQS